jgi:DNA-binding PadR family transcriptional regulator
MSQDMFDESMGHFDKMKRDFRDFLNLIDRLKKQNKPPTSKLTGQFTDIEACKNGLPKEAVDMLDPQKKEMLIKNIERAEKQGLIDVDYETQIFKLTEKGKEYIQNPQFQIERANDLNAIKDVNTQEFGIEMTGTDKDLLYFKNNTEFNLGAVKLDSVSPEQKIKFFQNIQKWSDNGLTSLSLDGKISLTAKGTELLGSKDFISQFGSKALTEKAIGAIPGGKIVVILKSIVTAAEKTAQTTQTAAQSIEG